MADCKIQILGQKNSHLLAGLAAIQQAYKGSVTRLILRFSAAEHAALVPFAGTSRVRGPGWGGGRVACVQDLFFNVASDVERLARGNDRNSTPAQPHPKPNPERCDSGCSTENGPEPPAFVERFLNGARPGRRYCSCREYLDARR